MLELFYQLTPNNPVEMQCAPNPQSLQVLITKTGMLELFFQLTPNNPVEMQCVIAPDRPNPYQVLTTTHNLHNV